MDASRHPLRCPSSGPAFRSARPDGLAAVLIAFLVFLLSIGCGSTDGGFAGVWTAAEGYGGLVIERSGDEYSITLVDADGSKSTPQTTTLEGEELRFSLLRGELPKPQGPDLIDIAARLVVSGDPATDRITLTIETSGGTTSIDLRRAEEIALDT